MSSGHRGSLFALSVVLLVNVAASALHFGDNMIHFHEYPEPRWITGPYVVDGVWFVMTPLLVLGWALAKGGLRLASIAVLWLYGGLSVFVLGHYFYASPFDLSLRINLSIGVEAVAAGFLLVVAPFLVPGIPFRRRRPLPLGSRASG